MRSAGVTVGDLVFFGALTTLAWWLVSRRRGSSWKRWVGIAAVVLYLVAFVMPYLLPAGAAVIVRFVGVLVLVAAIYVALCELVARAAQDKGRSATAWFFIAFFFAIVIPAVIVAIMGPQPKNASPDASARALDLVQCPYCAEDIRPEAIKCKHCGEMLPA